MQIQLTSEVDTPAPGDKLKRIGHLESLPFALSGDESNDKLKRIGHLESLSFALSGDESDDKLKRIGHWLTRFRIS